MRISSEVLLTFLLNAFWQVALIAALAAAGSWLLRNSVPRYHHWLTKVRMREGAVTEEMKQRMANDPEFRKQLARMELGIEAKEATQAAMVRLARINMDQAIQVATSQHPGKVLHANLSARGWEEPGKLGKDGVVFYHVIIANETSEGSTHVWVNAIDGSYMKSEKELPRKQRSENP